MRLLDLRYIILWALNVDSQRLLMGARRIIRIGATAAIAAFLLVGAVVAAETITADPADAGTGRVLAQPNLNIRSGPSGATTLIGHIPYNTTVTVICVSRGTIVNGPFGASNLWDKVTYGGVTGFVSDAWLFTGSANAVAPPCDAAAPAPGRKVGRKSNSNTGVRGNCTWGAKEKWRQATGYYPQISGDAWQWKASAAANGWTVVADAQPRSIVVFQPGVQRASRYGHVAWVDSVENRPDGRYIHITEMNFVGFNVWSKRVVKDVVGMHYILAP
jgi:surface antigen